MFFAGCGQGIRSKFCVSRHSQVVQAFVASGRVAAQFGRSGSNFDATVAVLHRFLGLENPSDTLGTVSDGTI